ncbi:MAG: ABC transporter permease, partial [Eubacteriales bacterium]|nr:ABC transporter permease [Eubacteriales bacterium]
MLLALKELNGSKLRYLLMVVVVTLMVWLVIFLVAMAEGLADETTSLFKNMPADYYVFSEKSDNILSKTLLEKKTINDLKKIEGVKDVTYLNYQPATLTDAGNVKEDAALFAIEEDGFIAPQIIEGRSLDKQNPYGVVVDNRLKVNGYRLGSYLQVEGYNQPLTIVGFTKGNAYLYLPVVFIHNQTWQEIRFGEDKVKMG